MITRKVRTRLQLTSFPKTAKRSEHGLAIASGALAICASFATLLIGAAIAAQGNGGALAGANGASPGGIVGTDLGVSSGSGNAGGGSGRGSNSRIVAREIPLEERRAITGSLKGVEPLTADVSDYIADLTAAQQLGKALFWDVQVGSTGTACASCHFHAGADIRIRNQVNPGLKANDPTFSTRSDKSPGGPNKTFTPTDFPAHKLETVTNRESPVVFDSNDVFSSQGSFGGDFISSNRGHAGHVNRGSERRSGHSRTLGNENCTLTYDPANNPFHVNGLIFRKVESRQTPTVINAVFNYRQFWDGRANNQFNGVDPFGPRTFQLPSAPGQPGNPDAKKAGTLVVAPPGLLRSIGLKLEQRLIDNASLASQAVGPPLSDFEMSCANKTFADLGHKLIPLRPLAGQRVHRQDSLLAATPNLIAHDTGLDTTYRRMIQRAFKGKYWADPRKVTVRADGSIVADPNGFTQMEHNFSLFWGLAIQAYEQLLISDDSPFDRYKAGDQNAISDEAKAGEVVFMGRGGCIGCHFGPALSGATVTKRQATTVIERMRMGNGDIAFYDTGYYNIGVRPTKEDLGAGATDPYGFDLSFARQFKWQLTGVAERSRDKFDPTPCKWIYQYWPCNQVPTTTNPSWTDRDSVDGSFKVPTLRNVGLNPPYFHNGGQATLKDVVRFYNRGGDRRGSVLKDTSGLDTPNDFGQVNDTNLDPDIGDIAPELNNQYNALGLDNTELGYLVQFLLSLTDQRVACHAGVFDHPELPLVMGQEDVAVRGSQVARDIIRTLPATGVGGLRSAGKPCFPNSGDLFGSINPDEPAGMQDTFRKILNGSDKNDVLAFGASAIPPNGNANGSTVAAADAVAVAGTPASTARSTVTNSGISGLISNLEALATGATGKIQQISATVFGSGVTTTAALDPAGTKGGTARPNGNGGAAGGAAAGGGAAGGAAAGGAAAGGGAAGGAAAGGGAAGGAAAGGGAGTTPSGNTLTVPSPPAIPAPVFTAAAGEIQGFEVIGFVQNASVGNQDCPDITNKRQWGGTAVVNSLRITIPCNTVLQMPAATLTWAELFPAAAGGVGTNPTPLSLSENASGIPSASGFAFPSTEIRIVGNIVAGRYIAGLVYISQQSLNTGSGIITGFDYDKGIIFLANKDPNAPPIKLQINDSKGRFSRGQSPDTRFNADDGNPTIRANTGYPMCVPRVDPAVGDDPRCPRRNRPLAANGCRNFATAGVAFLTGRDFLPPAAGQVYCTGFVMPDPDKATPTEPSSRQQAPFVVGDFLTYSGTLLAGSRTSPTDSDTISVHTISANVGIFTQPGTLPVYLALEEFRIAAFAPVDFINGVLQEEQDRLVVGAVVTDVLSILDVYLVDIDPVTGQEQQRWVTPASMTDGVGGPASNGRIITGGITTQRTGPVPGRARLRANRAVPGILTSPTRYIRVVARTLCDPANINGKAPLVGSNPPVQVNCLERAPASNGILSGQYMAPTFDFIFPETIIPGDPQPANNFWDLGFLVNGEGPGTGRLTPTPW